MQEKSPLLLNAMYSVAARYSKNPMIIMDGNELYLAGDPFYVKARELVDHYIDIPNITTVNALLILATYASGSGRGKMSTIFVFVCRIRIFKEINNQISTTAHSFDYYYNYSQNRRCIMDVFRHGD